jgi:hypothetical protein
LDYLKTKLRGEAFETLEELQERVEELFGQITPERMERADAQRIEKLYPVISTNGDYI